jgi:uncharacterized membrane protein YeaQ/YmgE (transglycosylase-associated protein family)
MRVTDYLTAILFGALVGLLGRLTLPGRQSIGLFSTGLVGVGAAALGTLVGSFFDLDDRAVVHLAGLTWSWALLGIQVGFAVVGIALAQLLTHTRLADNGPPRRRRRRQSSTRSS